MDKMLDKLNKENIIDDSPYYLEVLYRPVYHFDKKCPEISLKVDKLKKRVYFNKTYTPISEVHEYIDLSNLIKMGVIIPCKTCMPKQKNKFKIFVDGKIYKINLKDSELDLLSLIMKNNGEKISNIYEQCDKEKYIRLNYLSKSIHNLRTKGLIEPTIRGVNGIPVKVSLFGKLIYYNHLYNLKNKNKENEFL